MIPENPLKKLLRLASAQVTATDFDDLVDAMFSQSLTPETQQDYMQLLSFAHTLQLENSIYETAYRHLLILYVLNGGRLDALKSVDRRIRGLGAGHGSALVFISGVSGIGKTSLAMAFQERTQQMGAAFIVSHCLEQESTSYALWQDVARSTASVTSASRRDLPAPIGEGPEAKSLQHLMHTFADWLDSIASQPFVILLDDLHWADADSLELLDSLTSRSTQTPIVFIATYRSEEVQTGHALYDYLPKLQRNRPFDLIHLESLNQGDVMRLVSAYHGKCSPQLATYLHNRSEGHPFFTVELLINLIEHDLLSQDSDGFWLPPQESVPVPKILQQLITQRVSRLGHNVERLLAVAAIVGEIWHLTIVEPLLDFSEEQLLEALEIALRAELIIIENDEAEIYRFSHGLIKEVLYTQQLARRRKYLHEQIALQLEAVQPSDAYAVAYHFHAADSWENAVQYSIEAGGQAFSRFASHSALQLYQQALNAAKRTNQVAFEVHAEIYERLGRAYKTLTLRQDAETAYNQMRDVAHSMGDLPLEGRALSYLAQIQVNLYKADLAEQSSHNVLQIAEQSGNVELLAQGHLSLGKILLVRGSLNATTEHVMKSIRHAKALDDPVVMSESFRYLAYMAIWTGQYQEAASYAQQAYENAQYSGDPLLLAGGYQILSHVQIEMGQYVKAYDNILPMLNVGGVADMQHHQLPRLLNQLGYLYLELGNADEALQWDKQALDAARTPQGPNNVEMQRYSLLNIATDLMHLGRLGEAMDYVARFKSIKAGVDFAHFRYFNRYLLLMSEINLVQNNFEQAVELAQESRNMANIYSNLKNMAKGHWFEGRALVGKSQNHDAIVHFMDAIEIVDRILHASLRWKIRLSLAETLIQSGESPSDVIQQTRDLMDRTIRTVAQSPLEQSFLMSPWITRIETLEQNSSPQKPAYPAGLTQREVEVLRLVASGATNQQVADALHISVRTVNTHMTNILNKTNCDNRTAATAFAIQHHLVST